MKQCPLTILRTEFSLYDAFVKDQEKSNVISIQIAIRGYTNLRQPSCMRPNDGYSPRLPNAYERFELNMTANVLEGLDLASRRT